MSVENNKEQTQKTSETDASSFHFRKKGVILCSILAVFCLGFSGYRIYDFYREAARSEAKMEELRLQKEREESLEAKRKQEEREAERERAKQEQDSKRSLVDNPYADLFLQNPDMVAWLSIEGTKIDYPVMQKKDEEDYYLYRDFYGNEDKSGSLLLDAGSSLYDEITTNQLIHGHNMKAGTMFGELDLYQEQEYGQTHNHIHLYAKDMEHQYEVIAVFYTQVYLTTDLTFKYYNFFQANTEEEFQYFYENIKKLSLYDTGVEAKFGDRFLTLSTCSYQVEDGRFVVVAKEVEPGASYKPIES